MARPTHSWMKPKAILGILFAGIIPASLISADPFDEDLLIGKSLADLLQAGETVISREQDRINETRRQGTRRRRGAPTGSRNISDNDGRRSCNARSGLSARATAQRPNGRNR